MSIGINGGELIILIVLAILILGPEKLPEYARKLTQWIRQVRQMAEGAKSQFKEETGTDFDEIDWRKYDPRQYDPRRIIREALNEPVEDMRSTAKEVWDHDAERAEFKAMDPRDIVRGRGRTAGAGSTAAAGDAASGASSSGSESTALATGAVAAGAAGALAVSDAESSVADDEVGVEQIAQPAPFDTEAT